MHREQAQPAVVISTAQLARNLQSARAQTQAQIMAVVKANGYGMGLLAYARCLAALGITHFGVATAQEALTLRAGGIRQEILLLTPVWQAELVVELVRAQVVLSVAGVAHVQAVAEALRESGLQARCHVALDCGMHRYGFTPAELAQVPWATLPVHVEGAFTHFSNPCQARRTQHQHRHLLQGVQALRQAGVPCGCVHCCGSAAFRRYPHFHHDLVRLGTALVGSTAENRIFQLQVAAVAVQKRPRGCRLGYGAWQLARAQWVATLPVGYADGVLVGRMPPMRWLQRLHTARRKADCRVCAQGQKAALSVLGGAGMNHLFVAVPQGTKPGEMFCVQCNPLFLAEHLPRIYQ